MGKDFSKRGYSYLAILLLVFTSCVKTEVLDNVVMNQAFSLPLGERELSLESPDLASSTTIPGTYGTFFYNGRPYQANKLYFQKEELLDFKMDSISKLKWIVRVDFKIRLKNSFPANSSLQIYLLNASQQISDSVFVQGPQKAAAGTVNSLDEVQETKITVFDSSFEGDRLTRLKTTKRLLYKIYLETRRDDGNTLRFTNQSNIKVNLAMRLFLNYNLNEL